MSIYNNELTKDEMKEIEKSVNNIGDFGTVEIIKTKGTIDVVESKRKRIRNGKNYNKG